MKKTCKKCGDDKELKEFNKCTGSKDGKQFYCRSCSYKGIVEWRKNNRDHYNATQREYLGKCVKNLSKWYIRHQVYLVSKKFAAEITEEDMNFRRASINLHRTIQRKKNEN